MTWKGRSGAPRLTRPAAKALPALEKTSHPRSTPTRMLLWLSVALPPLLLGWAVNHFVPGIWDSVRGLGGAETLEVAVLFPDEFDSPLEADTRGELIWPMSRSQIPENATREEAYGLGAVDASTTLLRLNLRSSFPERVTIQQIAVDVERDDPLRGIWVTGDMGGDANVRYMQADLDEGTVGWVDDKGEPIPPLPIYVSETEEENVDLLARASDCYCRWTIELTYTVAGSSPRTVTVRPPGGDEFHTSGTSAAATVNISINSCTESSEPGPRLCD